MHNHKWTTSSGSRVIDPFSLHMDLAQRATGQGHGALSNCWIWAAFDESKVTTPGQQVSLPWWEKGIRNVEASNPCLGSWVGVYTVTEVASTLIKWKPEASGHCLLQAACLRATHLVGFQCKAMAFITDGTKQQESGRVLPCTYLSAGNFSHPKLPPCSLQAIQWGRKCVGRYFLSAESDNRIP